jgi:ribosomal protein S8E
VNFLWGSEAVTRKAHVLDVVYIMLSSNNELVTQTLVKNAIVQVDAAPFCQWYSQHCGLDIDKKKKAAVLRKDSEVICPCFCECLANSALFVFLSICSSHGASQQGFSEQAYLELHC